MALSLQSLVRVYQSRALDSNSHGTYGRHWLQWVNWCQLMQLPSFLNNNDANANTAQFGAFVVYLFKFGMNPKDKGNQYSTIKGKVSAVRWYHRYCTGVTPELDGGYKLLMQGIRRMSEPTRKKHPVTSRMLRHLR